MTAKNALASEQSISKTGQSTAITGPVQNSVMPMITRPMSINGFKCQVEFETDCKFRIPAALSRLVAIVAVSLGFVSDPSQLFSQEIESHQQGNYQPVPGAPDSRDSAGRSLDDRTLSGGSESLQTGAGWNLYTGQFGRQWNEGTETPASQTRDANSANNYGATGQSRYQFSSLLDASGSLAPSSSVVPSPNLYLSQGQVEIPNSNWNHSQQSSYGTFPFANFSTPSNGQAATVQDAASLIPEQQGARPLNQAATSSSIYAGGAPLGNESNGVPSHGALPNLGQQGEGLTGGLQTNTNAAGQNTANNSGWKFKPGPAETFDLQFNAPKMSQGNWLVPFDGNDFQPNRHVPQPLNPYLEIETYYGKSMVDVQRPWVEWWRPFYTGGMYDPGKEIFSDVNLFTPSFLIYGDYRTAVGVHRDGGRNVRSWAHRLNLDMDMRFTSTERFHMFTGPLDNGGRFTRLDFSDGDVSFEEELDFQPDTAFFEGDLGAITGSLMGVDAPFDLPFTMGLVPLLFQNGIWMEDAILGVAVASPWRHSNALNWANYDATFFAGFSQVTSPAFDNDNNAASVFGTAWFVEAYDGYIEMDYAYLNDDDGLGRSYHNAAIAYTRRYLGRISNSVRLIGNGGQNGPVADRTADGGLLIVENSLVSSQPSHFVPYCNLFVGNGRPQSVARAANAGAILKNVGINFESDGLTGYPTLTPTGSNSYGGALGINLLSADFYRQWMVEFAALDSYGDQSISNIAGPQYAVGTRYQHAINNRYLWRVDAMNGWFDNAPNIFGTRMEFRWKF